VTIVDGATSALPAPLEHLRGRYVLAADPADPAAHLERIVQAMHLLQSVAASDLGLVVLGAEPDATRARALRLQIAALRVRECWFVHEPSTAARDAIISSARVGALTSPTPHTSTLGPHELEARGVPYVVAGAGPDAGALRLPADAGPELWAEALLLVDERRVEPAAGRHR
jgi:hypothetical protein